MAEVTWENATGSQKSNIQWMKLGAGNAGNTLRVVSMPYKAFIHWEKTVDGANRKIVCAGASCPICATEANIERTARKHRANCRYFLTVIDKSDPNSNEIQVKALETGTRVIQGIQGLATDPQWGNPSGYDINIKKSGNGRDTVYNVNPGRNTSPLTDDEKAAVKAAGIDFNVINRVATKDEVMNMNLAVFGAVPADLGDDTPAPAQSEKKGSEESSWDDFM